MICQYTIGTTDYSRYLLSKTLFQRKERALLHTSRLFGWLFIGDLTQSDFFIATLMLSIQVFMPRSRVCNQEARLCTHMDLFYIKYLRNVQEQSAENKLQTKIQDQTRRRHNKITKNLETQERYKIAHDRSAVNDIHIQAKRKCLKLIRCCTSKEKYIDGWEAVTTPFEYCK